MWTTVARFATSKIISKVKNRSARRLNVPSGARKWILLAALSILSSFLVLVMLMAAVFAMATAATAPLRAASDVVSKIPLVGEPLSDAIGGDDAPSEEELDEIRDEAEEAGLDDSARVISQGWAGGPTADEWIRSVLAAWSVGGAAVIVRDGDDERLERIADIEKARPLG